jgi:hypothetical protein
MKNDSSAPLEPVKAAAVGERKAFDVWWESINYAAIPAVPSKLARLAFNAGVQWGRPITAPEQTPKKGMLNMTDDQIKQMVNRFLQWRLPPDFSPDGGISFKRTYNEHLNPPSSHQPVGTNLFTATQAEAMVRHMLDGISPSVSPDHRDESGARVKHEGSA